MTDITTHLRRSILAAVATTVVVGVAGTAHAGIAPQTTPATVSAAAAHAPTPAGVLVAVVTAPTAPRSPTATPGNARVKLAWLAPSSSGGKPINKYLVQRARAGGAWKNVASPTTRHYTVTGLTNGVRYYFRVRAHNAAGWGPSSTVVKAVPRTVPSAPRSPTATPGNGTVKLAWLAPSSSGGKPINKYLVRRAIAGGPWKIIATPTTRSYTATGLTNGTKYSFRIRAHNAAGWGPPSTTVSAIPYTVPTAPKSLTAKSGDNNVTLTWLAPSGTGGAPIGKYAVQWSTTGTSGWKTYAQPSTTTYTTSGFNCCQTFYLRILAHNAAGWSPASNVVGYLPAAPSAPQYLGATPGNQSVHLLWPEPASNGGASVDYYQVQWATSAGGPWTTDALEPSTNRVVNGLTNGTQYFFQVRAYNTGGYGPYSGIATATPSIVPSAPLWPLTTVAGTKVTLTWTTPQFDGGSPIQQYNVYATLDPNGPWTHIGSTLGPALQYVVNNAAPGKTTFFRIAAQNQFGEGPPAIVTAYIPPTVPGKVTVCNTTLPGGWQSQIIRVTWDPPISDGGEPILFYRVDVRVEGDPSVFTTTYVWSPSTTVDVDRLNDKYNEVLITPYNKIGAGPHCFISPT
jgi:hypothetical protein